MEQQRTEKEDEQHAQLLTSLKVRRTDGTHRTKRHDHG